MPTVALANEFLEAYSRLPKQQQKKVRTFTEKFQADPKSAAINYEKIHGVKDDKVRTVRIDQKYRAVILHPENGNVHVLVWVDNHDEAMAWARNKVFGVNPATGTLQVVNVAEAQAVVEKPKAKKKHGLFAEFDDETLQSLGVPAVLLPAIRAVEDHESLQSLAQHLPPEAAEALTWLAEGLPVDEVREAVAQPKPPKKVDTSDLEAALERPDTKRRFVTVRNVSELDRILDAPLKKWRIFLHPSQVALVQKSFNGPARVLGGAGTGKTVVAMHRARHLAEESKGSNERVLFTTFTANLAHNVRRNLKELCGDEFERIDVLHLHSWAVRFMRDQNQQFDIASGKDVETCWVNAALNAETVDWDVTFLRQEWERVVQANGIEDRSDYLKVPRTGRGQTLSRQQRARVWKVFEEYRDQLRAVGKVEWLDVIRKTRHFLEYKPEASPYRAVIVDEAQDFHPEDWRLIRAIAPSGPNDLFIVGDAHQRIYGRPAVLGRCGIDVRGRASKLRLNYRTTEQIRAWATAMLTGVEYDDLDGQADTEGDYKSLLTGPKPEVRVFSGSKEEKEFLGERLPVLLERYTPEQICVVTRTARMLDAYGELLDRLKLPHVTLDKNSDEDSGGIRLATMHRVKGLEFPCMILGGVNDGFVPLHRKEISGDEPATKEHMARERSLLFVAATRARDQAIVTAWGKPSEYLGTITS